MSGTFSVVRKGCYVCHQVSAKPETTSERQRRRVEGETCVLRERGGERDLNEETMSFLNQHLTCQNLFRLETKKNFSATATTTTTVSNLSSLHFLTCWSCSLEARPHFCLSEWSLKPASPPPPEPQKGPHPDQKAFRYANDKRQRRRRRRRY